MDPAGKPRAKSNAVPTDRNGLERAKGGEPSTSTMATWRSTAELRPHQSQEIGARAQPQALDQEGSFVEEPVGSIVSRALAIGAHAAAPSDTSAVMPAKNKRVGHKAAGYADFPPAGQARSRTA